MRLVLDTTVMVAAIRSDRGASRFLLASALALDRRITLLVSVPLLFEYEAVLSRKEQLDAANLSAADLDDLLDAVVAVAEPVNLDFQWRPSLRDPDDDMVLETATNGQADAIVTFNKRDFGITSKQFAIAVLAPGEVLQTLELKP